MPEKQHSDTTNPAPATAGEILENERMVKGRTKAGDELRAATAEEWKNLDGITIEFEDGKTVQILERLVTAAVVERHNAALKAERERLSPEQWVADLDRLTLELAAERAKVEEVEDHNIRGVIHPAALAKYAEALKMLEYDADGVVIAWPSKATRDSTLAAIAESHHPAQSAGEWTPERILSLIDNLGDDVPIVDRLAYAINAALAAEREDQRGRSPISVAMELLKARDAFAKRVERENKQLREQLAAEREKLEQAQQQSDKNADCIEFATEKWHETRQQLDTAVEALKDIEEHPERYSGHSRAASIALAKIGEAK